MSSNSRFTENQWGETESLSNMGHVQVERIYIFIILMALIMFLIYYRIWWVSPIAECSALVYVTEGWEWARERKWTLKMSTTLKIMSPKPNWKAWQLTVAAETVELITTAQAKMLSEKTAKWKRFGSCTLSWLGSSRSPDCRLKYSEVSRMERQWRPFGVVLPASWSRNAVWFFCARTCSSAL